MAVRTPDLDAEQEVDLGRYRAAVGARWWLLLAGLLAGAILGWLLALGGTQVFKADVLISLGQPFSPNGNAPVSGLSTNPRTVAEIIRSEAALKDAAHAAGLHVGALRGRVSSSAVSGITSGIGATRVTGSPLVTVSVTGHQRLKVEKAADRLATIVVERISPYVQSKITTFEVQLKSEQDQLNSIAPRVNALNAAIKAAGLSALDKLVLVSQLDNAEQRRGQLLQLQTETQQQLSLAQNIESARIVQPASAVQNTARSKRNSILVGAFIGLILGLLAAILWEPVAARVSTA